MGRVPRRIKKIILPGKKNEEKEKQSGNMKRHIFKFVDTVLFMYMKNEWKFGDI